LRLDLPPAFFLGAYIRLAMLGGLGLFVLGLGASFLPATASGANANFGPFQALLGLVIFGAHWAWLRRAPKTEYEPFLRRAYYTVGAVAFLAGVALFAPFALSHALAGQPALVESVVAALSLAMAVFFAARLNAELSS
jgi:drug/metabolite transporter (DMT)-like permease